MRVIITYKLFELDNIQLPVPALIQLVEQSINFLVCLSGNLLLLFKSGIEQSNSIPELLSVNRAAFVLVQRHHDSHVVRNVTGLEGVLEFGQFDRATAVNVDGVEESLCVEGEGRVGVAFFELVYATAELGAVHLSVVIHIQEFKDLEYRIVVPQYRISCVIVHPGALALIVRRQTTVQIQKPDVINKLPRSNELPYVQPIHVRQLVSQNVLHGVGPLFRSDQHRRAVRCGGGARGNGQRRGARGRCPVGLAVVPERRELETHLELHAPRPLAGEVRELLLQRRAIGRHHVREGLERVAHLLLGGEAVIGAVVIVALAVRVEGDISAVAGEPDDGAVVEPRAAGVARGREDRYGAHPVLVALEQLVPGVHGLVAAYEVPQIVIREELAHDVGTIAYAAPAILIGTHALVGLGVAPHDVLH
mmetsp:Transcript_19151/g.45988  ORF Transcript_19151/g.45988 Transcript_19151/m.45988 type:complete len:420 (-) Transcript_19151:307-1566(-)